MFAAYRTCVMPPVCPASVHVAERMWVSYSAAMPEYDPDASTPLATGLYARHEMIPAPRQQGVSEHETSSGLRCTPSSPFRLLHALLARRSKEVYLHIGDYADDKFRPMI